MGSLLEPRKGHRPRAMSEGLIVEDLPDETLVYDQKWDRMHCLNRTAAAVWRGCDGTRSVPELAAMLGETLGTLPDEDLVWLALKRLQAAHLLDGPAGEAAPEASRVSRRALARKLALAGGMTLLLPVVTSIVAPTPAMAASCTVTTSACNQGAAGSEGCCCTPNAIGVRRICENGQCQGATC